MNQLSGISSTGSRRHLLEIYFVAGLPGVAPETRREALIESTVSTRRKGASIESSSVPGCTSDEDKMAELLLMLLSPITFGARANASHINSTQHHNHAMANASVRMRRSSLDSQLHADRQGAHRQPATSPGFSAFQPVAALRSKCDSPRGPPRRRLLCRHHWSIALPRSPPP